MNKDYITTYKGGSGWMAVHLRWYEDIKGYDIQQSGINRYANKKEASEEAKEWAEVEELEFKE